MGNGKCLRVGNELNGGRGEAFPLMSGWMSNTRNRLEVRYESVFAKVERGVIN